MNFAGRKICHYNYSRFLSLCGKERNFVRCEDRPIVFHNSKILPTPSGVTIPKCQLHMSKSPKCQLHISELQFSGESWHLLHNHAGDKLAVPFQPHLVTMVPSTGLYHKTFCIETSNTRLSSCQEA